MKLTTNEDNIDGLKIAIAAFEAKIPLEVEFSSNSLTPCLFDENSDLKLFVANAACCYLHEQPKLLKKRAIGAVEGDLTSRLETLAKRIF